MPAQKKGFERFMINGRVRCTRCHKWPKIEGYTRDRRCELGIQGECKKCHSKYVSDRKAARRAQLAKIKMAKGCIDCGFNRWPESLHFDHLPDFDKSFNLGQFGGRKWQIIEAEIAKCEVVCANCHAHRTATRKANG